MIKTESEILGILKKHSPKMVEKVYTEDASSAKKEKIDFFESIAKDELNDVYNANKKPTVEINESAENNNIWTIFYVGVKPNAKTRQEASTKGRINLKIQGNPNKKFKAIEKFISEKFGFDYTSIQSCKRVSSASNVEFESYNESENTTPEQQEAIKNLEDVMIAALIDATDGPGGVAVETSVEKIYQEMMDLAESFLDEVQDAGGDMEYCSDCIDELFKRLGKKLQQADFSHYEAN